MTPEEQFGGSREISFAANTALRWERLARIVVCTATAASLTLTLDPATDTDIPFGHSIRIIVNEGANTFSVDDADLASPISLPQNEALFVGKIDAGSGVGEFVYTRFAVL